MKLLLEQWPSDFKGNNLLDFLLDSKKVIKNKKAIILEKRIMALTRLSSSFKLRITYGHLSTFFIGLDCTL